MRVWDIPVSQLCDKHLVAQHHEIHCIYSIITQGKKGFAHHPETMRWRDRLYNLDMQHAITTSEMLKRGMHHCSPLDGSINPIGQYITVSRNDKGKLSTFTQDAPKPWQPIEQQIALLKAKGCKCKV